MTAQYLIQAYKNGERNFTFQDFTGIHIEDVDLSGSNFKGSAFPEATLSGVNFTGANLSECSFFKALIHLCDFKNTNIYRAGFGCAMLQGVKNVFSFTVITPRIEQVYCVRHDKGWIIRLPNGGNMLSLPDLESKVMDGYQGVPFTIIQHLKTL